MAGYLGTKAVLLSTTAADVIGNAEIGGNLTVGGNLTSTGIDDNASSTAITIDGSQNVGIGTSSPEDKLSLDQPYAASGEMAISFNQSNFSNRATKIIHKMDASGNGGSLLFATNPNGGDATERMRIDSSGNLLVGKTSADNSAGATIKPDGEAYFVKSNNAALSLNRLSSDGVIQYFFKDTSPVGSIQCGDTGNSVWLTGPSNGCAAIGFFGSNSNFYPGRRNGTGQVVLTDNQVDLGSTEWRFDDIYATNGTIQTSDRNEKQDIDVLNAAETRVAVACKGLLRKFRWKDAVAEKGDDARIHFGIIAQDLQDAFTAEGLDAGRYAMFISSTWWETQTDVPAVQAVAEVLDDEGNVVTEAVEAKEAYTRTDTYETQEEAPAGAAERTRLGVRYPELLAFIIGAM